MLDVLKSFFVSSLERHRSKYMDEIQNCIMTFGSRSSSSSSSSGTEVCSEDEIFLTSPTIGADSDKITKADDETASMGVLSIASLSEIDSSIDGNTTSSGYCPSRDSSSGFLDLRTAEDISDSLPLTGNLGKPFSLKSHHGHRMCFSSLFKESGKVENGGQCQQISGNCVIDDASSILQQDLKENHLLAKALLIGHGCQEGHNSTTNISENTSLVYRGRELACNAESLGSLETLVDLSGDYDSHIRSLQYGQYCCGQALAAPLLPSPPLSPSRLRVKTPWDKVHPYLQLKQNLHSQMDQNGAILGNHFPVKHPALSLATFGQEEKQKPRGTGTYFPNMVSSISKFFGDICFFIGLSVGMAGFMIL